MRSSVLLSMMLLAAPAAALELNEPTDASSVPVTTGALMEAAKATLLMPVAKEPFAGARILSDAEIAALITAPYPILIKPETPPTMAAAKLGAGAAE
jgi:hypothetical protein